LVTVFGKQSRNPESLAQLKKICCRELAVSGCSHDHHDPSILACSPKQELRAARATRRWCALPTVVIGDFVSGAVAGLAVAMPIGAIGTYLIGLGARERTSTAAAAALGVASVDGTYAIVAALGGTGLQALISEASGWLGWIAALTLIAVAVRTVQLAIYRYRASDVTIHPLRGLTPLRAYLSLVALTAVNPATLVTFAAVIVGRSMQEVGSSWLAAALFALGAFGASAVWQLMLAGGGSMLGRLLRGRRGQLGIAACSALIMLGLAVAVLVS
jgi:arginine exporter protein ArgO